MRCQPRLPCLPSRRRVLAVLALVAQVFAATGAPIPSARGKASATAFPCRDHPCGCATAERCWAGDCCCFTLEEKLAWAEANGVEPPAHVRPLVEARKPRPTPPKPKKACCSEPVAPKANPAPEPSCCDRMKSSSAGSGGARTTGSCCESHTEPTVNVAEPPTPRGEKKPVASTSSGVRWVAGIVAQKCRGEGPAGLLKLELVISPLSNAWQVSAPEPRTFGRVPSIPVVCISHTPPTPPPRHS